MKKEEIKYTKPEYEFVCSLLWGSVPVDRKAAEETPMFKTEAPKLLEKYPKLDKSFHEEMSKLYGPDGKRRSDFSSESKFSRYAEPTLVEGYLIMFDQPDAGGNVYRRENMTPEAIGKIMPKDGILGFSIDDKGIKIIMKKQ